jgi:hypothetical protein
LALDPSGNLYVSQAWGIINGIRRIDAVSGEVTTLARDIHAGRLEWSEKGTLLAAPWSRGALYEVDPSSGATKILAGTPGQIGTSDGIGAEVGFSDALVSICSDGNGGSFLLDGGRLRSLSASGEVHTLAGHATLAGHEDGMGDTARFVTPSQVVADVKGNAYVLDGFAIRRITPNGAVTTFVGDALESGNVDGVGTGARLSNVQDLGIDVQGNLWVLESNSIRKVTPEGVVSTGFVLRPCANGDAPQDGAIGSATFGSVRTLAIQASGDIYVSDFALGSAGNLGYRGQSIRKITPAGQVMTVAGTYLETGMKDGDGSSARFSDTITKMVALGKSLFIVDSREVLRQLEDQGNSVFVTTLSKQHLASELSDSTVDGDLGTVARFAPITGLTVDPSNGDIYVACQWADQIRRIRGGQVTTLINMGVNDPGALSNTGVSNPRSLVVTPVGDLIYTTQGALMQITQP